MSEHYLELYRCVKCGQTVSQRLVHLNAPRIRLTCGCMVFEETQSKRVQFEDDLPDKWKKQREIDRDVWVAEDE